MGGAGGVGGGEIVGGEDARHSAVRVQDALGPGEPAAGGAPVEGEDQPVAAARGDDVVAVVPVRRGPDERWDVRKPLRPEGSQIRGVAALIVGAGAHVVVAGQHAVRHPPVDAPEDPVGETDLEGRAMFGDVAEVGEERDVRVFAVLHQPPERLV